MEPTDSLAVDRRGSYISRSKRRLRFVCTLVVKDGVVALHDALNAFEGPIRIFVEEILRSDQFGAAGVVQSTAWGQLRPEDGRDFRKLRMRIERRARRML